MKSQLALHLLLLLIFQLYHLSPPLLSPGSTSSCLFTRYQPQYSSWHTLLMYPSRYSIVRLKMSLFFKFIFIWRLIALQYCVGFCHTPKSISRTYICPLPVESPSYTPGPSFVFDFFCEKYYKPITVQYYVARLRWLGT